MLIHLLAGASAFAPAGLGLGASWNALPRTATPPRMTAPSTVAKVETIDVRRDQICTVCVALLGQNGAIEEMIEDGELESSDSLDYEGFCALVDSLEVQCADEDKQAIFAMITRDGSTTVDASKLKQTLRSSGVITRMYDKSLQTFGMLIAATLAFDVGVFFALGGTAAFDFLTAYAVEDSLSVDNLFVFLLIFRYFKVPPELVDICLNYGITGSIVLRGFFIFAGLAAVKVFTPLLITPSLLQFTALDSHSHTSPRSTDADLSDSHACTPPPHSQVFTPLLLGFSGFLLFSSYQLLAGGDDDDDDEDEIPQVVKDFLEKLPITSTFEGEQLVVSTEGSGVQLTQLTATLVSIALCDVLFAVDSIPAVLAVSEDPFVVYTSNIAAVVGLRSLYQLLSVAVSRARAPSESWSV